MNDSEIVVNFNFIKPLINTKPNESIIARHLVVKPFKRVVKTIQIHVNCTEDYLFSQDQYLRKTSLNLIHTRND